MSKRTLGPARLRHPLAAALGVGGIVLGAVAAVGGPANAAEDDLVATATFVCQTSTFPEFDWEPTITLSAARTSDESTNVLISASVSDMAGAVPVSVGDQSVTDKMVLDIDGTVVTLSGSGSTNIKANQEFKVPALQGTMTSDAATAAVSVTSFELNLVSFPTMSTKCEPTGGAELGTMTIVTDAGAAPTPTPTTTTSATATPTPSGSATPSESATSGTKGEPAKGTADFACELNIGSKFDWEPTVTVNGYREADGDPVSLVASMTDLPGIAPVDIVGPMDYTLDVEVGGEKTTLTSTGDVSAGPYDDVPVTDLTGEVDVDGDELEVAVTGFTFDFPSGGVGAECTADRSVLGTMTVGSEPIDNGGGDDHNGGGSDTGTGTLPQTGGGDSTPVILLWAGAFALLGAGALVAIPGRTRRLREH